MLKRWVLGLASLFVFLAPVGARGPQADNSLRAYVLHCKGRYAYGIYVHGKKVGWEVDEITLGRRDGKEVALFTTEGYSAVTLRGVKSITEDRSTVCYSLEGDGKIVFAESWSREDGKEIRRTVVPRGTGLHITTTTNRRKTERTVPASRDTLDRERKFEAWLQGPPKKGGTFTNYSAAWEEDEVDQKWVYTFQEKKTIAWGGVPTTVYLVRQDQAGAIANMQLLADGRPLTLSLGALMEGRLEKEADARKLDRVSIDYLAASAVPVDRKLGPPEKVTALTLRLSGLGDFVPPSSHRQRILSRKESTLELRTDFRVEKPVPLDDRERARLLKATASIQSDHEPIRTLARKIVGEEKDALRKATRIEAWVFKHVKKSYAANADNALSVLDNRAGDCTEHSLLFVALARAAGIPARTVGGIAYPGDARTPVFGWHEWAEIHDGRQWVSVDPTWHEVFVDATHVKLSEGNQDFAWVNVAGKLKVTVVAVTKKR
jgi:hypothetical protein